MSDLPKPPVPTTPPMSPEERSIWLAAKGAPPDMLLLTMQEYGNMSTAIQQQAKAIQDQQKGLAATVGLLGDYARKEPDVLNAVDCAVTDAERFKKGVDLAERTLRKTEHKLSDLIATERTAGRMPLMLAMALQDFRTELLDLADMLKRQQDQRRDRIIKPTDLSIRIASRKRAATNG